MPMPVTFRLSSKAKMVIDNLSPSIHKNHDPSKCSQGGGGCGDGAGEGGGDEEESLDQLRNVSQ